MIFRGKKSLTFSRMILKMHQKKKAGNERQEVGKEDEK